MKISVNGVVYEDVTWDGNGFLMETEMTLAEIEQAFIPGSNTNIIVYDGEQEIARYYNKGLDTISVSGSDPRIVSVTFNLTQINKNAEDEIRESIDTSDGAIEELGMLVAGITETMVDQNAGARLQNLESWMADMMRADDGFIASLQNRIARLEEIIGGVDNG